MRNPSALRGSVACGLWGGRSKVRDCSQGLLIDTKHYYIRGKD